MLPESYLIENAQKASDEGQVGEKYSANDIPMSDVVIRPLDETKVILEEK